MAADAMEGNQYLAERGEGVLKSGRLKLLVQPRFPGCPASSENFMVALTSDSLHFFRSSKKATRAARGGEYEMVAVDDSPERTYHLDGSSSCIGLPYGHSLEFFAVETSTTNDSVRLEFQAESDIE
eukprot:2233946-Rhodomonas_salina.1